MVLCLGRTGPVTFSVCCSAWLPQQGVPPTCHEEEQAGDVLRQTLLPEEADRRHDAAAQQDGGRHAQEACRDAPQI